MVDTELFIFSLRNQVRSLHALLNYLESRDQVSAQEYAFSAERLRHVLHQLEELALMSSQRGQGTLRASWLN